VPENETMPALGNPTSRLLSDVTAAVRCVLQDPDLELTLATRLDDIPGWDSMDVISVSVELECRYDILFELPEIDNFYVVGDLVRGIAAKCSLEAA
jgi:acyl carrier protein